MRAKGTFAALTAAVALAATAPLAQADSVSVTIDSDAPGQGRYLGKVKTSRDKCAKNRTVQVYDMSAGAFLIGATLTDAKGKFQLSEYVPQPGQQVRIVVTEKRLRRGGCTALQAIVAVPEDPAVP